MENPHPAWFVAKKLALGLILIASAAAVLLMSDHKSRRRAQPTHPGAPKIFKVAMVQSASQSVLEQGVQGMLDGLAARGFVDSQTMELTRYNSEGDMPTLNAIAREVSSGKFDLILSASTPALQAIANANKEGKTKHVFGLVSDPYAAGVGINPTNHLDHPKHLAGFGTIQPVAESFRLARKCFPNLKKVGVVWNPAESNSEINTKLARIICKELNIELEEANVENSSGVLEAANSVIARGIDLLWVGGDITVLVAAEQLISATRKAGIPMITVIPPHAERGALFDLGANYYEVGKLAGEMGGDVLHGRDPASIPIENVVPEILVVNKSVLKHFKQPWSIPAEMEKQASTLIDENAAYVKKVESVRTVRFHAGKTYKIGLAYFGPDPGAEACMDGLFEGLRKFGLEEGKNLKVRKVHAQGEISNIPSMLQSLDGEDLDVIIPMSTPCIAASTSLIKQKKIVFTYCYDPIAAGVGKSFADHLPQMTGVGSFPPVEETIDFIRKTFPGATSVGTLYNSSEANSRKVVEVARPLFQKAGIQLVEIAIANSSEVFQAAQVLGTRGVQAIWITGDNTALQAFDGIAKAAEAANLPLILNDPEYVERGALACIGLGFYHSGLATAEPLARVLLGESPKIIPIRNVSVKTVVLNHELAKKLGVTFPAEFVKAAEVPVQKAKPAQARPAIKKWKIHLVELVDTTAVEESRQGVLAGLKESGLIEGTDYTLKRVSAQGEMSLLPTIIDSAISENADMIYTITTPALLAAMQKVKDRPHLFTLALNPVLLGGGKSNHDHASNIAGVYDQGPFDKMVQLIKQISPAYKRIGTLFAPSEVNSVTYKDDFALACRRAGLERVAAPANSISELSEVTTALSSKVDIICQLGDNLSAAGFVSIANSAQRAKIPLFSFGTAQVPQGASLALANDYFQEDREPALIAARVMRGENPADIPYQPVQKTRLVVDLKKLQAQGVPFPPHLLSRADEVIGAPPKKAAAQPGAKPLTKKWRIHIVEYSNVLDVEEAREGVIQGLKLAGLVPGRDYEVKVSNAQNDMPTVNALIDSALSDQSDMLITLSTPTLQAALKKAKDIPIVFTYVADGIKAGAGRTDVDHLPNVTGVPTKASYDEMVTLIKEVFPKVKKVGTLFVPSESNTVFHKDLFVAAAQKQGLEVALMASDTAAEVSNATAALCQQGIDLICQIPGNLTASAFPAMATAARKANMPVVGFQGVLAQQGACFVVARDYYDGGVEAAHMAARIMRGESPANIPFKTVTKTRIMTNTKSAASLGVQLPKSLLDKAVRNFD